MSVIEPCAQATIAVAVGGRPDWDAYAAEQAVIRAYSAGWTPRDVLFEVVRLMAIEDSEPRDLDAATGNPWRSPGSIPRKGRPRG